METFPENLHELLERAVQQDKDKEIRLWKREKRAKIVQLLKRAAINEECCAYTFERDRYDEEFDLCCELSQQMDVTIHVREGKDEWRILGPIADLEKYAVVFCKVKTSAK